MSTFTPVQTRHLITPGNFFDKDKLQVEFCSLQRFISESFRLSLRIGSFTDSHRVHLSPYIDGRMSYFKDSKITDGGMIKAEDFEDLMYKLCAMIIGEQKVQIVSTDFRDLYTFLYQVESKELRLLGRFQRREDEEGFITRNECRSCGVKWPLG